MGAELSLWGPNSGSAFTNDATVGTIDWTNTGNVAVRDNTNAAAALTIGQTSHYLMATGFGFAIPAQVIIVGVVVEILRNGTINEVLVDNSVRLVVGGVVVGDERSTAADVTLQWSTIFNRYRRYGASVDIWGLPWLTPAQVNDPGFGIAVSVTDTFDEGAGATATIDHLQITIYGAGT